MRGDDEGGSIAFDYDERGRIVRKDMRPTGMTAVALDLVHRSDELLQRVSYLGGLDVDYAYNALGGLVSISGVIDAIEYGQAGRRTRVRYANGTEEVEDQLTGWRTTSVLSGPAGTLRHSGYTHDVVGNLTALSSADLAIAWDYTYDDAYRLVHATSAAGAIDYGYDAAFNLTSNSTTGAYGYGANGAAATCVTNIGADVDAYDDRGHLRSAPCGTHTVDAEGRVRTIALTGGDSESMTYGCGGSLVRRVSITGGLPRDVLSPDALIRIEDGVVVAQISDGNRIVARGQVGALRWLHYDHIGSLVLMSDASGAEVLHLTYDPYGQVLTQRHTISPAGFGAGQDMGHGLVLLGARWYSPRKGRFISPDPLVGDVGDPRHRMPTRTADAIRRVTPIHPAATSGRSSALCWPRSRSSRSPSSSPSAHSARPGRAPPR